MGILNPTHSLTDRFLMAFRIWSIRFVIFLTALFSTPKNPWWVFASQAVAASLNNLFPGLWWSDRINLVHPYRSDCLDIELDPFLYLFGKSIKELPGGLEP